MAGHLPAGERWSVVAVTSVGFLFYFFLKQDATLFTCNTVPTFRGMGLEVGYASHQATVWKHQSLLGTVCHHGLREEETKTQNRRREI